MNATSRIQNARVCITTMNAKPAEPAKTTVSLRALRSLLSRLYGFDDRRYDLEQVADDTVVGDFEDRRIGILVDGDDGARAFHADQMLNRAGDAEREVPLRRDRLPRPA